MDVDRRLSPLMHPDEVGPPPRARDLSLIQVASIECVPMVAAWHSRLPHVQPNPWRVCFAVHYDWTCFGVALWNNPSARTLPQEWLELRRMAVPEDAPHCTCSFMLGAMRRWIVANMPEVTRLISYQDHDVHTGTIYRAAGWTPAWETKARVRDRSKNRVGTRRAYRSNANGAAPDASAKTRWELDIR